MFHVLSDGRPTFVCRDITLERNDPGYRLDWSQIHAYNQTLGWHSLCRNLTPGPRCGAQIQQHPTLFQEPIFLVQLDQFEGSAGPVSFLFGKFVPLVWEALVHDLGKDGFGQWRGKHTESSFAMLLLDCHAALSQKKSKDGVQVL